MHGLSELVRRAFLVSVAAILLAACRGPEQPYEALAPQVANLRTQFNRDAGNVRIVILPAPN
jgi:hypothetical protein